MTNIKNIFSQVFFVGLILLAIGLPLSIFLVSLSQFILIGAWLLSGDIKTKLTTAFSNKAVMVLISVYLFHVIGLLYTHDMNYAFKDLRIKLPLLLLPVMFASVSLLTARQFKLMLVFFILAAFVSSCISTAIYAGLTHKDITDTRQISPFMSHIRLSMYICIAIFSSVWFFSNSNILWQRITSLLFVGWFLYFLMVMESITAYSILFFTSLLFGIAFILKAKSKLIKSGGVALLILFLAVTVNYVHIIWKEVSTINGSEVNHTQFTTGKGNKYSNDQDNRSTENGYLVNMNICEPELQDEWNKKSLLKYDEKNLRGDELRFTLIRFITSKGLLKDAAAVQQLNEAEVAAIEKGIANVDYMDSKSLRPRIKITLWELQQYHLFRNPDGHSIAMRLEFWRTALLIIKENFFIGVGTGDVPDAFTKKYAETNSPLSEKYRFRAHNQYITMAVALGVPFLLWFIFSLIAPAFLQNKTGDYLYLAFLLAVVFSFLAEDTLETQAGLSFYACFNCLFLFLKPVESKPH